MLVHLTPVKFSLSCLTRSFPVHAESSLTLLKPYFVNERNVMVYWLIGWMGEWLFGRVVDKKFCGSVMWMIG